MNLQENYKRLFKGRPASNDMKLLREDAESDAKKLQKELIAFAQGVPGSKNNAFGIPIDRSQTNALRKGFEVIEAEGPWTQMDMSGTTVSGKTEDGETTPGKKTGYEAGPFVVKFDPEENIVCMMVSQKDMKQANEYQTDDKNMNMIYDQIQKKFPPSQYEYNVRSEQGTYMILMRKKQEG